jgi:hypothetical protein
VVAVIRTQRWWFCSSERTLVRAAALLALGAAPRAADAQATARFAVHAEGGAGTMLASYQREVLGYGAIVQGAGRLAFTVLEPLALQLSGESWYAPSARGAGQQYSVTGGLRLEPAIGRVGRLFVDGNAGLGQSISLARVTVNAGVGAEFALGRGFALGPMARLGVLFATAT